MLLDDDFLIAIFITMAVFAISVTVWWIKVYGFIKFKQSVREVFFYFRWWMIGKSYCDVSNRTKLFLRGLRHITWGFILISVSLLLADIIKTIKAFL